MSKRKATPPPQTKMKQDLKESLNGFLKALNGFFLALVLYNIVYVSTSSKWQNA